MTNSVGMRQWFDNPAKEVLSGLVVAFAMIPEAIAFSGIAHVDPQVGLFGAFCLSVTIAFVGGRTAMITSATGSTALLMTSLVASGNARGLELGVEGLGLQYLLVAGILTGVLQILWGYLRLAHQMRFVPQGVLSGFVNALALLIFQAQLPQLGINLQFGEHGEHGGQAVLATAQIPTVGLLVVLGLVIIYGLPRLTRLIPSQLVAIVVLTIISINLNLDIPTVKSLGQLPGNLPIPSLPFGALADGKVPFSLATLGIVLPTALSISLVGLMETFLTQDILDDKTDTTSNKNREAQGQGIANLVSSLFGGMAGCALVGQSVMNIDNGGRGRFSTLFSGVSLMAMILLARGWVQQIPMAALVAVMISIAVSTADINGLRAIGRLPKSDTAVMVMTFAVTMLTTPHNLALGVLAGVALAALLFSRKVAKVIKVDVEDIAPDHRRYRVTGQLFFVSKVYFLQGFDVHQHPPRITIDLSNLHIWDQTGVAALNQLTRKLERGGSEVTVEGLNPESLDLLKRIGSQPEAAHG
ncbi:MAG: sodium-independent anion transporter [Synechococcus sp. TMED187]|jgi:SulP family sulfate permease|nr:MAG: sodium-independent anion transporter [Synechococcus sp. TMED187]RZO14499.1 MAG: SulP family inorganic anion transporter [Synechococcus sp. MED-G135]